MMGGGGGGRRSPRISRMGFRREGKTVLTMLY